MARPAKEIIDRLGPNGLTRALDDLLDQSRLVRLANTCGLKYRGMRTQSQSRARLVKDLADKARKQDDVGKAVLRVLAKETGQAAREWGGLDAEEKVRRLCDEEFLRADGNVGRHLFLLADAADGTELGALGTRLAQGHLLRIASNGAQAAVPGKASDKAPAKGARDATRLRRQVQERERKLRHSEAQLVKAREVQKTTKQDLIQRKGELAESRMLVERLRNELAQAERAVQAASGKSTPAASDKAVADLAKSTRQLVSEQKKLVHRLKAPADDKRARADAAALRKLLDTVKQLDERITADAKERGQQGEALAKRLDSLRAAVRSGPPAKPPKSAKKARPKGQAQRVGVFIDVQNMYYAARRLKGKLDFDALLEAAVQERRLIKTTAYVVESKETDQSQFIAMLQKRAIEVRRKALHVRADGSMKGDWDMELALDILDAAPGLDVVVLVSGDGDFTSLVKRVKSMGPRVEVIAFPRTTAKSLVQAADSFQPLDRKFMIYSRPAKDRDARAAEAKRQGAKRSKVQESKSRKVAEASGQPSKESAKQPAREPAKEPTKVSAKEPAKDS
jgi:uncharacterized LabA/DUF88 family protein